MEKPTGAEGRRLALFLLSNQQAFQLQQEAVAREAATRMGMTIEVAFNENSPLTQIQQILDITHRPVAERPAAILAELASAPASFTRVARAALAAGIGWVELSAGDTSLKELQSENPHHIVASVNADEGGIGWIHAEQCRALLPKGGDILYIEGPGLNTAVTGRRRALEQGLAGSHLKIVKTLVADWTEEGAIRVTLAWLQKQSSRGYRPDLVCAQNDAMAIGMRKVAVQNDRRWAEIPFLGCDGLPAVGQREVLQGSLRATVMKPLTTRRAVELVASIFGGKPPHAYVVLSSESFPPTEELSTLKP